MEHIRIPADVADVINTLQKSPLYPAFTGRSAVHIASELMRDAPAFREVRAQTKAEKHPRPGARSR